MYSRYEAILDPFELQTFLSEREGAEWALTILRRRPKQ
jgi:hypothetical protein